MCVRSLDSNVFDHDINLPISTRVTLNIQIYYLQNSASYLNDLSRLEITPPRPPHQLTYKQRFRLLSNLSIMISKLLTLFFIFVVTATAPTAVSSVGGISPVKGVTRDPVDNVLLPRYQQGRCSFHAQHHEICVYDRNWNWVKHSLWQMRNYLDDAKTQVGEVPFNGQPVTLARDHQLRVPGLNYELKIDIDNFWGHDQIGFNYFDCMWYADGEHRPCGECMTGIWTQGPIDCNANPGKDMFRVGI